MSFHAGVIGASRRRAAGGGEEPGGDDLEPVTALYWRLRFPNNPNSLSIQIKEVEMRGSVGGADQCSGGTPTASSGPTGVANAFDNGTASWNGSGGYGEWLQYQFASAVQVVELSVQVSGGAYGPRVVQLLHSNDGATWTEWAHWAGLSWTDDETKVLNAANRNVIAAGTSPFWRCRITANNGNLNLEITEVQFRLTAGGASACPTTGGADVGRTAADANWNVGAAFDGTPDATAAVTSMSTGGMWLGYMFPSNIAPVETAVRSDTNRATAPKDFTFGYSNDWGLTWTTVHMATDNIDWTSEERRVFDLTQPTSSGVRGNWHIDMSRIAAGWQISNGASSAENVSGGDNDPGFIVSNKTLGTTLPRYFEVVIEARGGGTNSGYIGIVKESERAFYQSIDFAQRPDSVGYRENGEVRKNNTVLASGLPTYGAGDIVMVAYDPGTNKVQFGLNGLWQASDHATLAAASYYAAIGLRDQGDKATLIGNEADFTYAKPAGYHDLAA